MWGEGPLVSTGCTVPSTWVFRAASSADALFWESMWHTKICTFWACSQKFIQVLLPSAPCTHSQLLCLWSGNLSILLLPDPEEPVKWLVITQGLTYALTYGHFPLQTELITIPIDTKCTTECPASRKHCPSLWLYREASPRVRLCSTAGVYS